jgi:5-dehydro-2-deoxygluconokinase
VLLAGVATGRRLPSQVARPRRERILEAPERELIDAFRIASSAKLVKGFAVGRTIFAEAAEQWLSGKMTDEQAVASMAGKFESLVSAWEEVAHVEPSRKTKTGN